MVGERDDTDSDKQPGCWEVPVFGAELLQPRTIVFSAETGRVVMRPSPDDRVIVPDDQVPTICAAARTALAVARRQRRTP
jgi:hypothetical protein